MTKGYASQLWAQENQKRNRRLLWVGVVLAIVGLLLVASSHAQNKPHTGGGGPVTHPPTAQQQISWGIGGAAAGNAVGAAICGAFSAGACAAGFGTGAAILGGIDWALNYNQLPDGEYVMPGFQGGFSGGGFGGGGGNWGSGYDSLGGGGGGAIPLSEKEAGQLTIHKPNLLTISRPNPSRISAFRLPPTHPVLGAFRAVRPQFDWRTTAVTAIQSNVLAPRYRMPVTVSHPNPRIHR